ncbi:unnamed protein product [Ectocarpus sp. 12 AP-2014]
MASLSGSGKPSLTKKEGEEDARDGRIMAHLQGLSRQQDVHKELLSQVGDFQRYWDLQQTWNGYARTNKALKEKYRRIELSHKKKHEERLEQRRAVLRRFDVREEESRREENKEIRRVERELDDHRQEWTGVVQQLNTYQQAMHLSWSGRLMVEDGFKQKCDNHKAILEEVIQRIHKRRQQKQVCLTVLVHM